MSKRTENRNVVVAQDLDVIVWTCDGCGVELTTSRDVYFGDKRLIVSGEDKTWLKVWKRPSKQDFPTDESFDFCSPACLVNWANKIGTDDVNGKLIKGQN